MRNLVHTVGLVALLFPACDDVRNPEFCGDGFCIDDSLPFCDIDGSIAGQAKTCIAVSCVPGAFEACRGDQTITCNATGDNFDVLECASGCIQGAATCTPCSPGETRCRENFLESCGDNGAFVVAETCDLACSSAGTPHCPYLEPKYLPDSCDAVATDVVTFQTSTFDTDVDTDCTGGIVAQDGGPAICIVRAKEIVISVGSNLKVRGTRALALVADTLANVAGTLDVSAVEAISGPGGGVGTRSSNGERVAGSFARGGGGGGFATMGGGGGSDTTIGGANNGGIASTNPALLTILIGGSRGGGGIEPGTGTLEVGGGGAGGAVMLVACRGKATITGTILAGGGGAAAATSTRVGSVVGGSPGYGGGSGGNVVIAGIVVEITGRLFANGGGGGSGNQSQATVGSVGGDGNVLGGLGGVRVVGSNNGSGGNGASTDPVGGGKPPTGGLPSTPGGGGGSVGFLQTYTPLTPTLNPSAQSPALQPNLSVKTR